MTTATRLAATRLAATRLAAAAAALASLAACAGDPETINREPALTAVGAGLQTQPVPAPLVVFPAAASPQPGSLYSTSSRSLYSDPRATHLGDTLTVQISLDEQARLDNRSERSRDSEIGLGAGLGIPTFGVELDGEGSIGSNSSSEGRGSIARSETLDLTIAAVVTDVLPNGNLVISGTQEVRVNHEMRVLSIAGIVRPFDISKDNTIAYDKIAEARLAYGGRGRLTEVQQPAYGQQVYDLVVPF